MAKRLYNEIQLRQTFLPKLSEVVDYVVQKIWNENKELIRVVVYEAYEPTIYNRTGEFKEAWDTSVHIQGNTVQGEFFYDPSKLTVGSTIMDDSNYGQHISATTGEPMTEYLADIIYQGLAGPAYGHGIRSGAWAKKRDAWNTLLKQIGKAKMKKWLEEGFARAGLPVVSHQVSLMVDRE